MDGAGALTTSTLGTPETRTTAPPREPWDTLTAGLGFGCGLIVFGFFVGLCAGLRLRGPAEPERPRRAVPIPQGFQRNEFAARGTRQVGNSLPRGVNRYGEIE